MLAFLPLLMQWLACRYHKILGAVDKEIAVAYRDRLHECYAVKHPTFQVMLALLPVCNASCMNRSIIKYENDSLALNPPPSPASLPPPLPPHTLLITTQDTVSSQNAQL